MALATEFDLDRIYAFIRDPTNDACAKHVAVMAAHPQMYVRDGDFSDYDRILHSVDDATSNQIVEQLKSHLKQFERYMQLAENYTTMCLAVMWCCDPTTPVIRVGSVYGDRVRCAFTHQLYYRADDTPREIVKDTPNNSADRLVSLSWCPNEESPPCGVLSMPLDIYKVLLLLHTIFHFGRFSRDVLEGRQQSRLALFRQLMDIKLPEETIDIEDAICVLTDMYVTLCNQCKIDVAMVVARYQDEFI